MHEDFSNFKPPQTLVGGLFTTFRGLAFVGPRKGPGVSRMSFNAPHEVRIGNPLCEVEFSNVLHVTPTGVVVREVGVEGVVLYQVDFRNVILGITDGLLVCLDPLNERHQREWLLCKIDIHWSTYPRSSCLNSFAAIRAHFDVLDNYERIVDPPKNEFAEDRWAASEVWHTDWSDVQLFAELPALEPVAGVRFGDDCLFVFATSGPFGPDGRALAFDDFEALENGTDGGVSGSNDLLSDSSAIVPQRAGSERRRGTTISIIHRNGARDQFERVVAGALDVAAAVGAVSEAVRSGEVRNDDAMATLRGLAAVYNVGDWFLTELEANLSSYPQWRVPEMMVEILRGIFSAGRCVQCTVDSFDEDGRCTGFQSCPHIAERSAQATYARVLRVEATGGKFDGALAALMKAQHTLHIENAARAAKLCLALGALMESTSWIGFSHAVVDMAEQSYRLAGFVTNCEWLREGIMSMFARVPRETGLPFFDVKAVLHCLLTGESSGGTVPRWIEGLAIVVGRVLGLSVAFGLGGMKIFPKAFVHWCKTVRLSPGELVATVVDTAQDLWSRMQLAWCTGELQALLAPAGGDDVVAKAMWLVAAGDLDIPGTGVGMTRVLTQLQSLDQSHLALSDRTHNESDARLRYRLFVLQNELHLRRERFIAAKFGAAGRPAPANILISGMAGVGKSALTDLLFTSISQGIGVAYEELGVFVDNMAAEFSDGYDPNQHPYILLDDIGKTNPNLLKGENSPELEKIIGFCGEAPYRVNYSRAEEKGRVFARPLVVVATTNNEDLNAKTMAVAPAAVLRRFPILIRVVVKEEFRKEGSNEIDNDKVTGQDWPWFIEIFEVRAVDLTNVKKELVCNPENVEQFGDFFYSLGKRYVERGEKYVARRQILRDRLLHHLAPQPMVAVATSGVLRELFAATVSDERVLFVFGGLVTASSFVFVDHVFGFASISFLFCVWLQRSLVVAREVGDALGMFAADARVFGGNVGMIAAQAGADVTEAKEAIRSGLGPVMRFYQSAWKGQLFVLEWGAWLFGANPLGLWFLNRAFHLHRAVSQLRNPQMEAEMAKWAMGFAMASLIVLGVQKMFPPDPKVYEDSDDELEATATGGTGEVLTEESARRILAENPIDWRVPLSQAVKEAPVELREYVKPGASLQWQRPHPQILSSDNPKGENSFDTLSKLVRASTVTLLVDQPNEEPDVVTGLCVGGGLVATVNHFIKGRATLRIRVVQKGLAAFAGLSANTYHLVRDVSFVEGDGDTALFFFPINPRRDLLKWLPTNVGDKAIPARAKVFAPVRDGGLDLSWEICEVLRGSKTEILNVVMGDGTQKETMSNVFILDKTNRTGTSGAFVALQSGSEVVLAGPISARVEFGGKKDRGVCGIYSKAHWEQLRSRLVCMSGVPEEPMTVVPTSMTGLLRADDAPLHPRSWPLSTRGPLSMVFAGMRHDRVIPRFKFSKTPLWQHQPMKEWMDRHGLEKLAVPSPRPYVVPEAGKLVYRDPWAVNFEGTKSRLVGANMMFAEFAIRDYLSGFPAKLAKTRVLTPEEAVFGLDDVAPMDLSRSAGLDGGLKSAHVDVVNKRLMPGIAERVRALDAAMDANHVEPAEIRASLKAEIRTVDKVMAGQTRVFMPNAFCHLIQQRRYLAPIVAVISKLAMDITCAAVGVNAANPREWEKVREHLTRHGSDGCFDLDTINFDVERDTWQRYLTARVFYEFAIRVGYSPEEARRVFFVVVAYGFVLAQVSDVVVWLWGRQSSGSFATEWLNSIDEILDVVTCYYAIAMAMGIKPLPFREVLRLLVYGDDLVGGTKPSIRSWFTPAKVVEVAARAGTRMTSGDKKGPPRFVDIGELVFLKRRFGPNNTAPLEMRSIVKSLAFADRQSKCPWVVRDAEAIRNAQRELVMHGRDAFEEFQRCLPLGESWDFGGELCLPIIRLNFEALWDQHQSGQLRTWEGGGQLIHWSEDEPEDPIQGASPTVVYATSGKTNPFGSTAVPLSVYPPFPDSGDRAFTWRRVLISALVGCVLGVFFGGVFAKAVGVPVDAMKVYATSGSLDDTVIAGGVELIEEDVKKEGLTTMIRDGTGEVVVDMAMARVSTFGSLSDILKRPVVLGTYDITSTTTNNNPANGCFWYTNPFSSWLSTVTVRRQVAGARFFSGVLKVHWSTAATPQHRGLIAIGTIYCRPASHVGAGSAFRYTSVPQMDGGLIPLNGPRTLEMSIPQGTINGPVDMETNSAPYDAYGTPWCPVALLAPLTHASLATAPTVPLVVRACLERGDFYSPTGALCVSITSGKLTKTTKAAGEERTQGLISRPASMVAKIAGALSVIPELAPFTYPVSVIASVGSTVAAALGYAKPQDQRTPVTMRLATNSDLWRGGGLDVLPMADQDNEATTMIDPGPPGFPDQDQMTIRNISGRPGVVGGGSTAAVWATTDAYGTVLMTLPVCPLCFDTGKDGNGFNVLTPAGYMAAMFDYWYGTAEFEFIVSASSLDAGRLRLSYFSSNATENVAIDLTARHSMVVDVNGVTCFKMKVGWQQARPVCTVPRSFSEVVATSYSSATFSPRYCNGFLRLSVDAPLVSNAVSQSIHVLVLARYPDLTLHNPSTKFMMTVTCTSGKLEFTATGEVPTLHPPNWAGYAQASTVVSLRQVLGIYTPFVGIFSSKTAATDSISHLIVRFPVSMSRVPNGMGDNTIWSAGTLRYPTFIDWLRWGFTVWRGAMRYRFIPTDGQASRTNHVFYSSVSGGYPEPTLAAQTIGVTRSTNLLNTLTGPLLQGLNFSAGWSSVCGIAVPYRRPYPWIGTEDVGAGNNGADQVMREVVLLGMGYGDGNLTTNTFDIVCVVVSMGDDAIFHGFNCGPLVASATYPLAVP